MFNPPSGWNCQDEVELGRSYSGVQGGNGRHEEEKILPFLHKRQMQKREQREKNTRVQVTEEEISDVRKWPANYNVCTDQDALLIAKASFSFRNCVFDNDRRRYLW